MEDCTHCSAIKNTLNEVSTENEQLRKHIEANENHLATKNSRISVLERTSKKLSSADSLSSPLIQASERISKLEETRSTNVSQSSEGCQASTELCDSTVQARPKASTVSIQTKNGKPVVNFSQTEDKLQIDRLSQTETSTVESESQATPSTTTEAIQAEPSTSRRSVQTNSSVFNQVNSQVQATPHGTCTGTQVAVTQCDAKIEAITSTCEVGAQHQIENACASVMARPMTSTIGTFTIVPMLDKTTHCDTPTTDTSTMTDGIQYSQIQFDNHVAQIQDLKSQLQSLKNDFLAYKENHHSEMAMQLDSLLQKSKEVSQPSIPKSVSPIQFYGIKKLDLDVSFGQDTDSMAVSTDLSDNRMSTDLSDHTSVITLHNEYEHISTTYDGEILSQSEAPRQLHPLRDRSKPLLHPQPMDFMQPPAASSPGLLSRAASLFTPTFLRGDSADNDPPPKVMDLGQSGGFHWDAEKKRYIFDDEDGNEEEEDVKPPPKPVTVSVPRERGRVNTSRFVDPFAGQTPEKRGPEESPIYNNKQDDDDEPLDDEEDFMMTTKRRPSGTDDLMSALNAATDSQGYHTDRSALDAASETRGFHTDRGISPESHIPEPNVSHIPEPAVPETNVPESFVPEPLRRASIDPEARSPNNFENTDIAMSPEISIEPNAVRLMTPSLKTLNRDDRDIDMISIISERDNLQSKVEILHRLKAQSDLQINKLQNELKSEQSDKSQLRYTNDRLSEQATQLQERVIELQVGNGVEGADEADGSDELESLQLRAAQLDIERINIQFALNKKEQKIAEMNESFALLRSHADKLTIQFRKLQDEREMSLSYKEEQIKRTEESLASSRKELRRLKEIHRQTMGQLDDIRSKNEESSMKVELLIQGKSKDEINLKRALFDKRKCEENLVSSTKRIRDLESEVRRLESDLASAKYMQTADVTEEVLIASHRIQQKETEVLKLETALISGQKRSEELEITLLERERKLANMTKDLRNAHITREEGIKNHSNKKKVAKEKASKLEEDLNRLNIRNEKTKGKMKEFSALVNSLTQKNEEISSMHEQTASEKDTLKNHVATLEDTIRSEKEQAKTQLSAAISDEVQKRQVVEDERNTLDGQVTYLESELLQSKQHSTAMEMSKEQLSKQIAATALEQSQLQHVHQQSIESIQTQLSSALTNLQDSETRTTALLEQINQHKDAEAATMANLQDSEARSAQLQDQIESFKEGEVATLANLQNAEARQTELQEQIAQFKIGEGENETLRQKVASLEEYIDTLQDENETRSQKVASLEENIDSLQEDKDGLQNELVGERSTMENLNNDLSFTQEKANSLAKQLSEVQTQLVEKEHELLAAQDVASQAQFELSQRDFELETCRQEGRVTAEHHTDKIQQLTGQIEINEQSLNTVNDKLQQKRQKLHTARNDTTAQEANQNLEQRIEEMEKTIEALTSENEELLNYKSSLAATQDVLTSEREEKNSLREKVHTMQDIIAQLEKQLETASAQPAAPTTTVQPELDKLYEENHTLQQDLAVALAEKADMARRHSEELSAIQNSHGEELSSSIKKHKDKEEEFSLLRGQFDSLVQNMSTDLKEKVEEHKAQSSEESSEEEEPSGWFSGIVSSLFLTDKERGLNK